MDISTDRHLLHCHFVSITRHWLPHKRLLFVIGYKNRFRNVWRTIGYILALVPWRFFFSMPVSNVCFNPSYTQQVWFLWVRDDRYKGLCMPMPMPVLLLRGISLQNRSDHWPVAFPTPRRTTSLLPTLSLCTLSPPSKRTRRWCTMCAQAWALPLIHITYHSTHHTWLSLRLHRPAQVRVSVTCPPHTFTEEIPYECV